MKKIVMTIATAGLLFSACNNGSGDSSEINALREEAIAIHDEIMPQVSMFDRNTVKIDSILANLDAVAEERPGVDTSHMRAELTALRTNLTNATENMMTWMHDFDPNPDLPDEETKAYYQEEVRRMETMKQQFDDAAKQTTDKLAPFQ